MIANHTGRGGRRQGPEPQGHRIARVPFAFMVAGLIIGGLALLVALNTASAANELRRSTLSAQDAQITASVEQLRNEIAASAAPANLASAARQLGMVPAQRPAFIVLGPHGSARVLGKPAAVPGPVAPLPPTSPPASPSPQQQAPGHQAPGAGPAAAKTTSTSTAASTSTSTAPNTAGQTPSATATPTPTPTPTPTMTMPGGAR